MVSRATLPVVPPSRPRRPPAANTAPMTARMITTKASTRQNVNLRRSRRRSTIVSASNGMGQLLESNRRSKHMMRGGLLRASCEHPIATFRCDLFVVLLLVLVFLGLALLASALERGAENVAQGRA